MYHTHLLCSKQLLSFWHLQPSIHYKKPLNDQKLSWHSTKGYYSAIGHTQIHQLQASSLYLITLNTAWSCHRFLVQTIRSLHHFQVGSPLLVIWLLFLKAIILPLLHSPLLKATHDKTYSYTRFFPAPSFQIWPLIFIANLTRLAITYKTHFWACLFWVFPERCKSIRKPHSECGWHYPMNGSPH